MYEVPTTIKSKELVEKRRRQIVDGAIKVLSQKGFHKSTLKELAKVSGLSHGSIYDYISTKEDIFFLMHELLLNSFYEEMGRIPDSSKEPLEKFRSLLEAEFNNIRRSREAILLLHQESHILPKSLLKKFLVKEREHTSKWESVLKECIQSGLFYEFNARLVANLIRTMIETWVLKMWDLKGNATQLETERAILDILLYGLLMDKDRLPRSSAMAKELQGKRVAIVNEGTELGSAIFSFFASNGAKVSTLGGPYTDEEGNAVLERSHRNKRVRHSKKPGESVPEAMTTDLSPIEILIHDLGAGTSIYTQPQNNTVSAKSIEAGLHYARSVAAFFRENILEGGLGRIIYLAPWAWDRQLDPLGYEMLKAMTVTLTKTISRQMATSKINVNCIIPGFIKTQGTKAIEKQERLEILGSIPMGYLGEIADVIEAIAFLVSDSSRYVTGQILSVGGGID